MQGTFLGLHEDLLGDSLREPAPSSAKEASVEVSVVHTCGSSAAQTCLRAILENRLRRKCVSTDEARVESLSQEHGRISMAQNTCSDALPQGKAHLGLVKHMLDDKFSFFLSSLLLLIH